MVMTVIPARGGSKMVPRKNLQTIGGVTLVERAIRIALAAGTDAVVSSDDEEILAIAKEAGAIPVERPAELATDTAVTQDAVQHVIDKLGYCDELVVMMQPSTPFSMVSDILYGLHNLRYNKWAATVTDFHDFVIQNGITLTPTKWMRRQDMPIRYVITGGVYVYRTNLLSSWRELYYDGSFLPIVVPKTRAVNIDLFEDLEIARALHASNTMR
jgi:CMP-N-acetylneuraminic acid synthetase